MTRRNKLPGACVLVCFLLAVPGLAGAQILVEASPASHDFGDVVIGAPAEQTFVLTNVGTDIGVIETIQLTVNHVYTLLGTNQGIELYPASWTYGQSSTEVTIVFDPDVVGDYASTILVRYDDGWPQTLVIPLSGRGTTDIPPPVISVEDLIVAFDQGVDEGSIDGVGPCAAARIAKLKIFRFELWAVNDLFNRGRDRIACKQLERTFTRCDGEDKPKDFIEGAGVQALNDLIGEVLVNQGCW